MKLSHSLTLAVGILTLVSPIRAQVPGIINYQGRVVANGVNFNGTGQFKFALVNGAGNVSHWSNDGSSAGGSQPTAAISLTVSKGLYSVLLGDTSIPNMTVAIPATLFTNADVRLRVWFNDGVSGFQQLSPDQRIAAVGYAIVAASVDPASDVTGRRLKIGSGHTLSGTFATIAGGSNNTASGQYAMVGGGDGNIANGDGSFVGGGGYDGSSLGGNAAIGAASFVGGGYANGAASDYSTVSGGLSNRASGVQSAICGGRSNTASGVSAFIGSGVGNAAGDDSVVGGGDFNTASGANSFIGSGFGNTASGRQSFIGSGINNDASAYGAMVPGGVDSNATGTNSFAAGTGANAIHDGAFVWADNSPSTFTYLSSTASNQFSIRAAGGVRFFSNSGATVGVVLNPGANAWSPASDRNVKENFRPVDVRAILEKVGRMPVSEWNLISQEPSIRHIGPMAQDFKATFGVGEDDRHISTTDADGVAFAAIQGLYETVREQQQQINELRARLVEIQTQHDQKGISQ